VTNCSGPRPRGWGFGKLEAALILRRTLAERQLIPGKSQKPQEKRDFSAPKGTSRSPDQPATRWGPEVGWRTKSHSSIDRTSCEFGLRSEGPLVNSHAREGMDSEREISRAPKVRHLLVSTVGPSGLIAITNRLPRPYGHGYLLTARSGLVCLSRRCQTIAATQVNVCRSVNYRTTSRQEFAQFECLQGDKRFLYTANGVV